jgi:hypothetical protein
LRQKEQPWLIALRYVERPDEVLEKLAQIGAQSEAQPADLQGKRVKTGAVSKTVRGG